MSDIRAGVKKLMIFCLALLLVSLTATTVAFAWETEQQALNNVHEEDAGTVVMLRKLEKSANGKTTENVVPGAVFRLYKEDGTLIGGPFATDLNGQIKVKLPPGNYYYMETTPPEGYTYDWDENENAVKRYPFTVKETDESLLVLAYNRRSANEEIEVVLPAIIKKVEGKDAPQEEFTFVMKGCLGCPMPNGATGRTWKVSRTGKGTVSLGSVFFDEAGDYTYTVCEEPGDDYNWEYDDAEYTLIIHISEKKGKLFFNGYTLKKDGKHTEKFVFTNVYEAKDLNEKITITGEKTWNHLNNLADNWPERIVVQIYADGKLLQQRVVTERTGWKYSFEVPKYSESGKEILYKVDEDAVENYKKQVVGYDLFNTYTGDGQSSEPGESVDPDNPETNLPAHPTVPPQTGDEFKLTVWLAVGALGLCGFVTMLALLFKSEKRYQGKHLKKK